MHYFISTREDYNTSAIELAQVKRMHLFDSLGVPCRIVELQKNDFDQEAQEKLDTKGRVLNLFKYFQHFTPAKRDTQVVLTDILTKNGLRRKGDNAYDRKGKAVIQAHLYNDRLYYVDYLDQYGFTVKREFYSHNLLSYVEYFDDQAHLKMRVFLTDQRIPVVHEYFCQSQENQPMLTLIELQDGQQLWRFDKIAELEAYFLDKIAAHDQQAVFYSDRSTNVLPAFALMKHHLPCYVVLHSALTPSGYLDDQIFTVYQPIKTLTAQGRLNGVISSTQAEADDVARSLQVKHSYAIPVTYIQQQKRLPFTDRREGRIIAVARVDEVKQLGQLIKVVIALKKRHPQLELRIYGNSTSQKEEQRLRALVSRHQADKYIHFCGFAQDLTAVYDHAQLEVLTSKNEGFAMALAEAQAHGVPAVSYDINYGPKEIIADGKSGRLVPPNATKKLRQIIDDLLSHPALLNQMSANAYENSQKFDFAHIKEKWQAFLATEKISEKK